MTFVSAVASDEEESVLNAVQLLWVNLIMDTFAALALATDPPTHSILDRAPDKKSAPLISVRMGKMIIGQAICQLAITVVLNFAGASLLGYDMSDETDEKHLRTLIFNTFVWLQIFNALNNRRLDNKLNILEGITKNKFFILIMFIMVGGQVLIIFVGGEAFKIKPLDGKEWGLSIGLGAISIPWGMVIRKFPDAWAQALTPHINLAPLKFWKKNKGKKGTATDDPEKVVSGTSADEGLNKQLAKELPQSSDSDSDRFGPPLRTLTSIRGNRARIHQRGFRKYMHDKKEKVKDKMGSKVDLSGTSGVLSNRNTV